MLCCALICRPTAGVSPIRKPCKTVLPCRGLDRNHDEIFLDNAGASYEIHIYAYLGFRDDWWEFHQSSDLLEFHARLCVYDENLSPLLRPFRRL